MPPGVVGGVSPRQLASGNTPSQYPDQLSANTTFLQTGAGGFARISTALQALNQSQNVFTLSTAVGTLEADVTALQAQVTAQGGYITALQGQVATLQGQVTTLQGQVSTLQGQVSTLQGQVAAQQVTINSFNYFQTEVSTGTLFLDQRTVYKRSIVINGALNTALTNFVYPHGIPNISYIVNIQAMASQPASAQYPITFLNMPTAPSLSTGLSIWADNTNIVVSVGTTTFVGYQVIATMWYTATDR